MRKMMVAILITALATAGYADECGGAFPLTPEGKMTRVYSIKNIELVKLDDSFAGDAKNELMAQTGGSTGIMDTWEQMKGKYCIRISWDVMDEASPDSNTVKMNTYTLIRTDKFAKDEFEYAKAQIAQYQKDGVICGIGTYDGLAKGASYRNPVFGKVLFEKGEFRVKETATLRGLVFMWEAKRKAKDKKNLEETRKIDMPIAAPDKPVEKTAKDKIDDLQISAPVNPGEKK
ncbi:MAG TPA: hypothetical protein DET40_02190 [Lentisphaeria bacterium]|nr:MAG: hypothetical protein A2X45_09250 [Lentisphaerae bacterium GWF2_50_93]HCE42341.1 hypothetical protein [Lentisphaeria bacterium]